MKLNEQKRDRQDKALSNTSNPPKVAEVTAPTPYITMATISTTTSTSTSTMATSSGKEEEGDEAVEKEKQ